jgi:16S rRNA (guanine(966)-N(2))-methyltransferase RsmD
MKILGGKYKGKNFYMPLGIRPTRGIVREAVFDVLGQDLTGMFVLDLFAGSGAVGIEAVSHGAERVVGVEKDSKCAEVISENLSLLPIEKDTPGGPPYEILQMDAFAAVKLFAGQGKKFDMIFVDPPYSRGLAKKALKTLGGYDILQPNCVIFIQHDKREILPEHQGRIVLFRQRKYGSTYLSIYQS